MSDQPPLGLLVSMAMRCDHGFAMLSHRAQQVMLSDMRRCWEEVTGNGFYHPDREGWYLAALRPEGDPGLDPFGTSIEGTVTDPATAAASQLATGGPESRNTEGGA